MTCDLEPPSSEPGADALSARAIGVTMPKDGRQVVEVEVSGGYRPAIITARADEPLRLIFRRLDDDPCTERVVFSNPRLERKLAARAPTVIDLPAQPAGEVRFTCGMGRYRGSISLQVQQPSLSMSLRRLTPALFVATVVVACALPILLLLAAITFDATAMFLAAAVALALLMTIGVRAASWPLNDG
jgi:hypothetical protein